MKRIVIILSMLLVCMGTANLAFANGGAYCQVATVIPGNSLDYSDSGTLTGAVETCFGSQNLPPYNEVFYTFTPTVTRVYQFRAQVLSPGTDVAIRVTKDACCLGSTTVLMENYTVPTSCDPNYTVYAGSDSIFYAGVQYWIHVGNNHRITGNQPSYNFRMLSVDCPTNESATLHNTCTTAQSIALNDSILGDSAFAGNPDWFSFLVPQGPSMQVTISVFGKAFGHCNSGNYPHCLDNPLNAHYELFCLSSNGCDNIAIVDNGGCSTDAVQTFCLPADHMYAIKVANNSGAPATPNWRYVLTLMATPSTCTPLVVSCPPQHLNCPNDASTLITLHNGLNQPIPGGPKDSACVFFRPDLNIFCVPVTFPVFNASNIPTFFVKPGCCTPGVGGVPATTVHLTSLHGHYVATPSPHFVDTVCVSTDEVGCVACVRVDYEEPVELQSFTASSGDGRVTLNWSTASESNVDHFELIRDGVRVQNVQAVNRSSGASYNWTDNTVINGVHYNYTLYSVDQNSTRRELRSVSATPVAGASVINEYSLRQNYPNPFNPTTSITFDLVEAGDVSLKVFNLMGQEVAILSSGTLSAGQHTVNFNAATLPSGVYVYRLTTNAFVSEKKMLLMK